MSGFSTSIFVSLAVLLVASCYAQACDDCVPCDLSYCMGRRAAGTCFTATRQNSQGNTIRNADCVIVTTDTSIRAIVGTDGVDCVFLDPGSEITRDINTNEGVDYIIGDSAEVRDIETGAGGDCVYLKNSVVRDIITDTGADWIKLSSCEARNIDSGNGADCIDILGPEPGKREGSDKRQMSSIIDLIMGGAGADCIKATETEFDQASGNGGADHIVMNDVMFNTINGNGGVDNIDICDFESRSGSINGGNGNDRITAKGSTQTSLRAPTINGDNGNDVCCSMDESTNIVCEIEDCGAFQPSAPSTEPPMLTDPPTTDPPMLTDPPTTDPPMMTDPPTTDPPMLTDPPTTDPPMMTDPPTTDPPMMTDPPTTDPPMMTDPPTTDPPMLTDPPTTDPPMLTEPPTTDPPMMTEPPTIMMSRPVPGSIIITEFMVNPNGMNPQDGQFIELTYIDFFTVNLEGCILNVDGQDYTLPPIELVGGMPAPIIVFGNNQNFPEYSLPGLTYDYEFSPPTNFSPNTAVVFTLSCDGNPTAILEQTVGGPGFPTPDQGTSIRLNVICEGTGCANTGSNWCDSVVDMSGIDPLGMNNIGTPGFANSFCDL